MRGARSPTCSYQASPDLNAATNYQDLWWLPSESGWGANFAHQGNTIYATWYTYDAKGRNNAPLWLSALMRGRVRANVFTGNDYPHLGGVASTTTRRATWCNRSDGGDGDG